MKHFNNCGDWESVEHYVKDIMTMSRKVQEIQRTANWITQEEIQLKYPITSFPEIVEINNYIEPYIRLYVSVHSWRKLLKRWLDGDFHNLNADDIENQTDEMSRYPNNFYAFIFAKDHVYQSHQGNVSTPKSVPSSRKTTGSW